MNTEDRREQHKIACRELREFYKKGGICTQCGQNWQEPGHVLCKACALKARARLKRCDPDGVKHKEYLRELRRKRLKAGLCIDCAAPAVDGKSRCKVCLAKRQESNLKHSIKRRIAREQKRMGGKQR